MTGQPLSQAQPGYAITNVAAARTARALLAAGGAGAVILSAPPALIDHAIIALGFDRMFAIAAPPIGLDVRMGLAALIALTAGGLVWAVWGRRSRLDSLFDGTRTRESSMASSPARTSGFSWAALLRVARGHDSQDPALSRRRADRHPDAPPRPPLMASRDLPDISADSASIDVTGTGAGNPTSDMHAGHDAFATVASIIQQSHDGTGFGTDAPVAHHVLQSSLLDSVQNQGQARALPRSPEPFTDEELAVALAQPAAASAQADAEPSSAAPTAAQIEPSEAINGDNVDDLPALLARFEQGLARRSVVANAQSASAIMKERIDFAVQDIAVRDALRAQSPVEPAARPVRESGASFGSEDPGPLDRDVEAALENALETLRSLTTRSRR